jgi:hypothetical protein
MYTIRAKNVIKISGTILNGYGVVQYTHSYLHRSEAWHPKLSKTVCMAGNWNLNLYSGGHPILQLTSSRKRIGYNINYFPKF